MFSTAVKHWGIYGAVKHWGIYCTGAAGLCCGPAAGWLIHFVSARQVGSQLGCGDVGVRCYGGGACVTPRDLLYYFGCVDVGVRCYGGGACDTPRDLLCYICIKCLLLLLHFVTFCYIFVTLLLHFCYIIVTFLLHFGYMWCYRDCGANCLRIPQRV